MVNIHGYAIDVKVNIRNSVKYAMVIIHGYVKYVMDNTTNGV